MCNSVLQIDIILHYHHLKRYFCWQWHFSLSKMDKKLYKWTLSLGRAAIIMTSSTVTIHHCPLGKCNQRDDTQEEPSDSSTFPRRQVCGASGVGGSCGFAKKEKKNWWTKGWQCHFYLFFLLAQANDSLMLTETLLSVALVFVVFCFFFVGGGDKGRKRWKQHALFE